MADFIDLAQAREQEDRARMMIGAMGDFFNELMCGALIMG